MQDKPHEAEDVPPDRDRRQAGDAEEKSAGSPEAPTGPRPGDAEAEPGTERDPDREGPTPDSENPAA